MPVEQLKIDSPPRGPLLLGAYHHPVAPSYGVPKGTFSSTHNATSQSSPFLTSSCQCIGTGMGLWQGLGVAVGSIDSVRGGPDIMGSGWCSHVLKALAA